jgi:hypothetical protein
VVPIEGILFQIWQPPPLSSAPLDLNEKMEGIGEEGARKTWFQWEEDAVQTGWGGRQT